MVEPGMRLCIIDVAPAPPHLGKTIAREKPANLLSGEDSQSTQTLPRGG